MSVQGIEDCLHGLLEVLRISYEESSPLLSKRTNTDKTWWNATLSKLRKESRHLFNKCDKCDKTKNRTNDIHWFNYKNCLTDYNNQRKKAIRESLDRHLKEIESASETSRLHKLASKTHSNKLGTLKTRDGTSTKSGSETLQLLADTHFPNCEIFTENTNIEKIYIKHDDSISNAIFSEDVIKWAIKSFKPYKSPGCDGVIPVMLQKCVDKVSPVLKSIFTSCHAFTYIPRIWRKVKVRFIPKGGITQSDQAKSYRPISLSSFLLKTMEKIIKRHIDSTALRICPLQSQQFAYQEGKSTISALQSLVKRTKLMIGHKLISLNVFTVFKRF